MWTPTHKTLMDVLGAARRLLDAREAQMVTADNWQMLQVAVDACAEPTPGDRVEAFYVDPHDGALVRAVRPRSGKTYEHRCPKAAFEQIANAAEEQMPPYVMEDLQQATGVPFSQAAVAYAFMVDRGVLVPASHKRSVPSNSSPFLDAMTEYHALREKGPTDPAFGYPEVARA